MIGKKAALLPNTVQKPDSLHGNRDTKSHGADARAHATQGPTTPSHDLANYRKDKPHGGGPKGC